MDKGKRPMTAAELETEERAKKTNSREARGSRLPLPQYSDPLYHGPPPLSSQPPFVAEPQDIPNVFGNPLNLKVPTNHMSTLLEVGREMERNLNAQSYNSNFPITQPSRAGLGQQARRAREMKERESSVKADISPTKNPSLFLFTPLVGRSTNLPFLSKSILAQRARRDREKKEIELQKKHVLYSSQNPSPMTTPKLSQSSPTQGTSSTQTPFVLKAKESTHSFLPMVPITGFVTKAALAQRARRQREKGEIHTIEEQTQAQGTTQTPFPSRKTAPPINNASIPNVSKRSLSQQKRSLSQQARRERERNSTNTAACFVNPVMTPANRTHLTNPSHETQGYGEEDYVEEYTMWAQNGSNVQPNVVRHNLGKMDVECPFCKALHWIDERLSNSSISRPRFGTCCLQGKVRLPPFPSLPIEMQELYEGNDARSISFRNHSRDYNNAFAFTSIGVDLDQRIFSGHGPRPFIIHGELKHRTGALLPNDGDEACFSQIYIYDPADALTIRQRRNPTLRADVFSIIQRVITNHNRFAETFRHAYELLREAEEVNPANMNVHATLHYSSKKDKRRYNLPTADEVAVIVPGDGFVEKGARDIRLHLRGGQGFMQINECHPAYLPLHYVLFFPCGNLGWAPELLQWNASRGQCSDDRLTQLDFYSYLLFKRRNEYNPILRLKKLTQQFIVDAWAATEQNKLRWVLNHQDKIRVELYDGIIDVANECISADQIGRRVILPSSHHGSPRHMFEIYQDSLAITRYNRHPDIFLTMTANPKWPEVLAEIEPGEDSIDRPEVITKVFHLKRKALMREIKFLKIFGCVVAHVFTIEFQKRGLPHMHALFYLKDCDKIKVAEQIDQFISAEFPNKEKEPELYETVIKCMVHGPCGKERNPGAPCMMDGDCSKYFPRQWSDKTTINEDGYPTYMRRDDGVEHWVNNIKVDNRDVVPYNPYLTKMFDCHINVEVCAGIRCVKYIHKYIYKGHDRTTMVLQGMNEVFQYLDARYVGPPEAAHHLLGYPMHGEEPNVVRLDIHLLGMHKVRFNPNESLEEIKERAMNQRSTLTAFFERCASGDPLAKELTYQEMPQHYVWQTGSKSWTRRQKGFAIGRLYWVNPNSGELFYMRLLLTVKKGPTSFEDLKTVDGVEYNSYKEACVKLGILEDDGEWAECLREAAAIKTGYQLRRLFCIILIECNPVDPLSLWNEFAEDICDDLRHTLQRKYHLPEPTIEEVFDYGLHLVEEMLFESGRSLKEFPPMPLPQQNWRVISDNPFIWEQQNFRNDEQNARYESNKEHLNAEQRHAFDMVLESVTEEQGKLFFLNGPAGTGKTFLYNTIAATCRSKGDIVLMVASSGIASLLLAGGRTAHSTFKIPFNVFDDSVCVVSKHHKRADLFRQTKLIIWDEVPMQHKWCLEAVERTFRDFCEGNELFGKVTVVLGGDFRQCLPVVPKGCREQIVGASLRRSFLWRHINVLTLTQNMRLDTTNIENVRFAEKLAQIGTDPSEMVQLPTEVRNCSTVDELLKATYPGLANVSTTASEYLNERTILSARNDDAYSINNSALHMFQGDVITRLAADKMAEVDERDPTSTNNLPTEYLNTLNPSGLPPFELNMKVGSPIMLLRNLAPKDGMCNGTRLRITDVRDHCINAVILNGDKAGEPVFIPRISLTPSAPDIPVIFTRRQFPVRLAFAMTINKSQGQSVKYVGIDLRNEVFSHGQLYVALSRCTSANRISVLLPPNSNNETQNVVYPEVLL